MKTHFDTNYKIIMAVLNEKILKNKFSEFFIAIVIIEAIMCNKNQRIISNKTDELTKKKDEWS